MSSLPGTPHGIVHGLVRHVLADTAHWLVSRPVADLLLKLGVQVGDRQIVSAF